MNHIFKALWSTFQHLSSGSMRLDIIFDIYLDGNIKQNERQRRSKDIVEITIASIHQPLPVEMDKFWGSASNKMQLEQIFLDWFISFYKGSLPVFLGGANKVDITSCYKVSDGVSTDQEDLKCFHEEADDRMLFHVTHSIKKDSFKKVVIASPDTDVFVNSIHHFNLWMYSDLQELWFIAGKNSAIPIHELVSNLDGNVVDVLPAVHALTGTHNFYKNIVKLHKVI